MDWSKIFTYDPTSPTLLRWAIEIWGGANYKTKAVEVGDVAGSFDKSDGYFVVLYSGKKYKIHRIICEMFHGKIPKGYEVDHIDGNRQNNLYGNLRAVTKSVNQKNASKRSSNVSGVVGVYSETNGKSATPYWTAEWRDISGKKKRKRFNAKAFGDELAFFLACEYRDLQIQLLNLQGAGYTNRHGT